jgi:hypothetical protein
LVAVVVVVAEVIAELLEQTRPSLAGLRHLHLLRPALFPQVVALVVVMFPAIRLEPMVVLVAAQANLTVQRVLGIHQTHHLLKEVTVAAAPAVSVAAEAVQVR